ncbi:MAG: MCE family protein [Verrucomicrobia bacterium]|nr:MCE family protein [Verrucomicrobiota bacterium]
MSRKANPTLIGVFVFGAILIAIGAVVFFGSANFFAKRRTYVSFFTQSVSGLSIGSNVKFKGVTVGKVTKVLIGFIGEHQPVYAKVFFEVNESTISRDLGPGAPADLNLFDEQWNERQIQNGLRAKLDF